MNKHTPEPWIAELAGSTGGENPTDIYEITNGHTRIAEYVNARDAKLIAAAPDLAAALSQLLTEVGEMTARVGWAGGGGRNAACAALTKAGL